MNITPLTLKQTTQNRMSRLGKVYGYHLLTAKAMVALLVEDGMTRAPSTHKVCMWMKLHPQFTTIRTSKKLQFKYIGVEEE